MAASRNSLPPLPRLTAAAAALDREQADAGRRASSGRAATGVAAARGGTIAKRRALRSSRGHEGRECLMSASSPALQFKSHHLHFATLSVLCCLHCEVGFGKPLLIDAERNTSATYMWRASLAALAAGRWRCTDTAGQRFCSAVLAINQ